MGNQSTVLTQMEQAGFTTCAQHVFFILREQVSCSEDGRVPVARTWFTEKFGYTAKAIRVALTALEKAGWIAIQRTPGGYSFCRVTYRQEGRVEGRVEGRLQGRPLTVLETEEKGRPKGRVEGRPKGHPSSTAVVDVTPAVDTAVLSSGSTEDLQPNTAAKKRAAEVEADPEQKAVWRRLCDHISATWAEKKKRSPGWSKEGWIQLAHQAKRFQCCELAAMWDEYLKSTDSFIVGQAHSLIWFASRAAEPIADFIDYKKRGKAYEAFWNGTGPDPRVPQRAAPPPIAPRPLVSTAPRPAPMPTKADPEITLEQMHRQTVAALKRCPTKGPCVYCGKQPVTVKPADLNAVGSPF